MASSYQLLDLMGNLFLRVEGFEMEMMIITFLGGIKAIAEFETLQRETDQKR
jgi:hypothetical protein